MIVTASQGAEHVGRRIGLSGGAEVSRYRSRVLDSGCAWSVLIDEVGPQFAEFRRRDSFAWSDLLGMRQDAAEMGMAKAVWQERADYRIPINHSPDDVTNPPWLGEFKILGRERRGRARFDYRMYFSEPVEEPGLVIVCGLGWKNPAESKHQTQQRQRADISRAMRRFQRFCREQRFTYPAL